MHEPVSLPADDGVVNYSDQLQILEGDGAMLQMDQVKLVSVFSRPVVASDFVDGDRFEATGV